MPASEAAQPPALVAGRACGYCTVCCYAAHIDTPEFQKPSGITCKNCTGRGCGIYMTRPPICRTFYCGWWVWPQLDDDWRPDRSGVLIQPTQDNIPDAYRGGEGWALIVLGGEESIQRQGFVELVLSMVVSRVPAFLVVPGPPAFHGEAQFLNDVLAQEAKAHDRSAALAVLLAAYREMLKREFKPEKFESRPETRAN